jgi:hypothetical protein
VSFEIDQLVLPSEEWREMLASAAVLDLVHGGYYRARPTAILFFSSPENAPEGWPGEFPDGSPELPRALVGEVEVVGEAAENLVRVRLRVSNWAAVRAVKQAFDRGEYRGRFQDFVLDQESALRGRAEDRQWLRVQFDRLRAHSRGALIAGS